MNIEEIKAKIVPILIRSGVKRAGLFGSIARGDSHDDSDVDILVEVDKKMSLLDFVGLKLDLEDELGRKVDLGEYSTIKPIIREQILNEEVQVL